MSLETRVKRLESQASADKVETLFELVRLTSEGADLGLFEVSPSLMALIKTASESEYVT